MDIRLSEIPSGGEKEYSGEEPPEIMDFENDPDFAANGPISYEFTATVAAGDLVIQGQVAVDVEFTCFRCTRKYQAGVSDNRFLRVIPFEEEDESVSLTEDIRESIILAFPTKPLCDSGCRGLCSGCGVDLNREECKCPPASPDDRWDALSNLKLE